MILISISLVAAFVTLNLWLVARRDNARGRALRSYRVFADNRFVFLSLPGLTLLLFGFGFMGMARPVGGTSMGMVLAVLAGICTVFGLVFSFWGIFGKTLPRFAQPRWMRTDLPSNQNRRPGAGRGKNPPRRKKKK